MIWLFDMIIQFFLLILSFQANVKVLVTKSQKLQILNKSLKSCENLIRMNALLFLDFSVTTVFLLLLFLVIKLQTLLKTCSLFVLTALHTIHFKIDFEYSILKISLIEFSWWHKLVSGSFTVFLEVICAMPGWDDDIFLKWTQVMSQTDQYQCSEPVWPWYMIPWSWAKTMVAVLWCVPTLT